MIIRLRVIAAEPQVTHQSERKKKSAHRPKLLLELLVPLDAVDQLEELVRLGRALRVLREQAPDVLARDGVDDVGPLGAAHVAVDVEDGLVGQAVVDAGEAVVQAADVDDAAGEAEAAAVVPRQCLLMFSMVLLGKAPR